MITFDQWQKNHETEIALATRNELAYMAFSAGVKSKELPPILYFHGRQIKTYTTYNQLTLDKADGFEFEYPTSDNTNEDEAMKLQIDLRKTGGIKLIDWIYCSQHKPCLIEFSNGDIIDYSDIVENEGASTTATFAFMAYVEVSEKFINIIQVIEEPEELEEQEQPKKFNINNLNEEDNFPKVIYINGILYSGCLLAFNEIVIREADIFDFLGKICELHFPIYKEIPNRFNWPEMTAIDIIETRKITVKFADSVKETLGTGAAIVDRIIEFKIKNN